MDISVIIGLLVILSEISILAFMLMKEWICPFIGQCVFNFYRKVKGCMENKDLEVAK